MTMPKPLSALLILAGFVFAQPAAASPMFSGTATASITVVSIDGATSGAIPAGLEFLATSDLFDFDEFAGLPPLDSASLTTLLQIDPGTGILVNDGFDVLLTRIGASLTHTVSFSGVAGSEFASAFAHVDGHVDVYNDSGAVVEVVFALAWSFSLQVSGVPVDGEDAYADAFFLDFEVENYEGDYRYFDILDVADPFADLLFPPLSAADSGGQTVTLEIVDDGDIDTDDGYAASYIEAGGFAEIPEPASVAILGLALGGLGLRRRPRSITRRA